jgi:hypothetical protein
VIPIIADDLPTMISNSKTQSNIPLPKNRFEFELKTQTWNNKKNTYSSNLSPRRIHSSDHRSNSTTGHHFINVNASTSQCYAELDAPERENDQSFPAHPKLGLQNETTRRCHHVDQTTL